MPTWWRLPDDGGQINQRKVEDGGTGLSRVKEVCQKFQILEDQTVAHVLQEQEVEEHLAANKQKAKQVRVNLRVARKLQEEEDEQSRRLARKLRRQLVDMENDYRQMLEEELQWQEETRQPSHTEQRKSRARRFSGETGRRSEENEEDPVTERRAGASLWHGIRDGRPRSRRPFVAAETDEGATWCEGGSGREGDGGRLGCGSDVEGGRAAVGSGPPQVDRWAAAERQRHRSPARRSDPAKRGQKVGGSPEDGDPPASTQDQPKQHRTRPCVTEGSQRPARGDRREAWKLDPPAAGGGSHCHLEGTAGPSTAASVPGYLAASPPAALADRKEHDAFRSSASDSESYPRRRWGGRDPEDVRAGATSEVNHRPIRARHGNKHRSPGSRLPVAETPPAPRNQPGIEGRAENFRPPPESKEKLGQDGRWKVERGRDPSASGGQVNEIHQLLADKEKGVHHPLAASQKHVHHPLAASQKHVHHPLAASQKHIHHPLAASQKHVHHPLAASQKHVHRPLAVDQKHGHHPLAADQKHGHHPLAANQKHIHHPLAVHRRHVHWPMPVGEDQAHHPLAHNQKQAWYPQATNQNHALHLLTVDKHVRHPPRTKAKGKQVHFQLAPLDGVTPNQTRLAHKEKQIQLPLDSKGKEVRSSLAGKQRHVRFPLAVGEKETAVRGPLLVKENGDPHPLAGNGKEQPGPSPLPVKRNPIQYRLESKDTEAIIDYVLDKRKGRASSSPKQAVRSPPACWEDVSGQSRGSPAEVALDKARLLVSKPPAGAREEPSQPASWRAEKDPTWNPSSGCPNVMSDSVNSSGCSDEAPNRWKAPSCPRRGHHRPRSRDTRSRGQAVRRSGHSRSHSPSDWQHRVPAGTGRDSASSRGSDPRDGLPASLWCSNEALKALQALELRRAQLRKATADEKQLQLARDEEFALDLLRQEVMAVSFSDKQKQSDLMQRDKNKKPPRSASPSSVNVDWAEESMPAFF